MIYKVYQTNEAGDYCRVVGEWSVYPTKSPTEMVAVFKEYLPNDWDADIMPFQYEIEIDYGKFSGPAWITQAEDTIYQLEPCFL